MGRGRDSSVFLVAVRAQNVGDFLFQRTGKAAAAASLLLLLNFFLLFTAGWRLLQTVTPGNTLFLLTGESAVIGNLQVKSFISHLHRRGVIDQRVLP